ncbi:hypothetical protein ACFVUS_10870 [Nocardia sp. NPDC058058]|uniref:hypothetical protein n=1 Tax=Nocardia sp. NPDC058058 TaxID=3346317 RepID=UPI0036D938D4
MTTAENPPTSATESAAGEPTAASRAVPDSPIPVDGLADRDEIPGASARLSAAPQGDSGSAVSVDDEAEVGAGAVEVAASAPSRRGRIRIGDRVGLPAVLGVAAVVLLLTGGLGFGAWHFADARDGLRHGVAAADGQAADQAAALKVGGDFLATAYTVDAVNDKGMAKWNAAMTGATTDTLKEQVRQTKALLSLLAESDASMTGVVSDAAVISQNDTLIRMLAVVKLTGKAPGQAAPTTGSVTEYVDLMKVGGQWKVFGYKDIGSKTGAGQDGALAGLPAAQPGPAK